MFQNCLTALVCLLALAIAGCHKKVEEPKPATFSGCRIQQIVETYYDTVQKFTSAFTYNDNGTIARIETKNATYNTPVIKTLSYSGSNIVILSTGATAAADTLQLGDDGRIVRIAHTDHPYSTVYDENYTTHTYDTLGQLILTTKYYRGSISTQNYFWKNGDMISSSAQPSVLFIYDTAVYLTGNTNVRARDMVNYGRSVITNRHLPLYMITNGTDTLKLQNKLDASGKLLYSNEPYNLIVATAISYTCK